MKIHFAYRLCSLMCALGFEFLLHRSTPSSTVTAVFIYGKKHLPGERSCTRDGLAGWELMGIGLFRENASNWTESRSKDLYFSSRRSYLGPSARATESTHIGRRQQQQQKCPFFWGCFSGSVEWRNGWRRWRKMDGFPCQTIFRSAFIKILQYSSRFLATPNFVPVGASRDN